MGRRVRMGNKLKKFDDLRRKGASVGMLLNSALAAEKAIRAIDSERADVFRKAWVDPLNREFILKNARRLRDVQSKTRRVGTTEPLPVPPGTDSPGELGSKEGEAQ